MSTAPTTRWEGDQEIPVLLRLPDLNAPVWSAAAAAPAPAVEPLAAAAVESPGPSFASLASSLTSAVASSVSATVASLTAKPATPAPSPAESSEVAAANVTTLDVESSAKVTVSRQSAVAQRDMLTTAQWNLIRQLAAGGVLVGSVFLGYLYLTSGGDEPLPAHIPAAQMAIEPPMIETPNTALAGSDGPVVVRPDDNDHSATTPFAAAPPAPEFAPGWADVPPSAPGERSAAFESPRSRAVDVNTAEATTIAPPTVRSAARPSLDAPAADGYQGRVGPPALDSASASYTYPETDPATYEFRPGARGSREAASPPREARLNGTIAPGPRR